MRLQSGDAIEGRCASIPSDRPDHVRYCTVLVQAKHKPAYLKNITHRPSLAVAELRVTAVRFCGKTLGDVQNRTKLSRSKGFRQAILI